MIVEPEPLISQQQGTEPEGNSGQENQDPDFTSAATFSVVEHTTWVGTIVAQDDDSQDNITGYAIIGGSDQDLFEITSGNQLYFKTAPDFEESAGPYSVVVTVTSGSGDRERTASQTITVAVEEDLTPPTILSVIFVPPDEMDTYANGEDLAVVVRFDEEVDVTGKPRLELELDNGVKRAKYRVQMSRFFTGFFRLLGRLGSDEEILYFAYTVKEGDEDVDGIVIGAIDTYGGTIQDKAGNDVILTYDNDLIDDRIFKVDAVGPTFVSAETSVDGTEVIITFSESLSATTPRIQAFRVTVAGSRVTLNGTPTVSGTDITLTLETAVTNGQTVTVRLSSSTDVKDLIGNNAAFFFDQPVTNRVE